MTKEQARYLVDAHEIDRILNDREEWGLLEQHNPALLEEYTVIMRIAELPY